MAEGIHTDPAKIKAVFELSEPSSLEEVRLFLGFAGYYRKFIPDFATIAAPLTGLTKKDLSFFGLQLIKMLFNIKTETIFCSSFVIPVI